MLQARIVSEAVTDLPVLLRCRRIIRVVDDILIEKEHWEIQYCR